MMKRKYRAPGFGGLKCKSSVEIEELVVKWLFDLSETDFDLVGTIMEQQTTMMLSLHRARNSDDSTTIETEPVTKFSGSGDENTARIDGPTGRKVHFRSF